MPRRHIFKIVSLLLLAAVGMLAVGASAAQAKWLIKLGSNVVDSAGSAVQFPLGELLVDDLGLAIHCEKGSGAVQFDANNGLKDLVVAAIVEFAGCSDLLFFETCDVHGADENAGTITVSTLGFGAMKGANDVILTLSTTGKIVYSGPECPLTQIDGKLFGSVAVELKSPATHTPSHGVEIIEQSLHFGENDAELHDSNGSPVKGAMTHPESISITLSGL